MEVRIGQGRVNQRWASLVKSTKVGVTVSEHAETDTQGPAAHHCTNLASTGMGRQEGLFHDVRQGNGRVSEVVSDVVLGRLALPSKLMLQLQL